MRNEKVSLSVENFSLENLDNTGLSKIKMFICHDGENRNGSIISKETIENAIPTLFRKPILYKYDKYIRDVTEHVDDEISCGYIHELNNNVTFEKIDDRDYLVAEGMLWNFYCPEVIDVFNRDGDKSISMEIQVIDYEENQDKKMIIKEFRFLGVTLLGNHITSGMINTTAKIVEFSKLTKKVDKMIKDFSKKKKTIDKIKELSKKEINDDSSLIKEHLGKEDYKMEDEVKMAEVKDEEIKDKEEMAKDDMGCHSENKEEMAIEGSPEEEKGETPEEEKSEKDDVEEYARQISEFKKKLEEKDDAIFALTEKFKALEESYNAKDKEFAELKEYKAKVEEKEKMEYVESLFNKYSKVLNKEEIEIFKSKIDEYENVKEFSRELKSFAADKMIESTSNEKPSNFITMGLIEDLADDGNKKNETIWDKLRKQK